MRVAADTDLIRILRDTRIIAMVGASNRPARDSHRVIHFLQSRGYHVIPVNPRLAGQPLAGQTVRATLADITEPVDMVEVFRRPDAVPSIVEQAIEIGARTLWLQLGVINEAAAARAANAGLEVVMDRCPAIEIPRLGL